MRQREFILHQMEGRNVMDTAVEIDTSHQNVSKALKTANWDEFKAGIELIQGFIKDAT